MSRNRSKRKKKPQAAARPNFLDVLGSTAEVDEFIEYLSTYPGYVAWIEEDQIIMERYEQRIIRESRHQYVVTREQDILMWHMQQGAIQ